LPSPPFDSCLDTSEVTPIFKERRPKSFEIDESKLSSNIFTEYGYDWMNFKTNMSKDVGEPGQLKAASLQAISKDSIPGSSSSVSTRDLIDRYVRDLSGLLSYLAPSAQVGLVYNGVKHKESKIMLDLGSNVCLVDDQWCKERGIPVIPTTLRLTLASSSTNLIGITPVLTLSYGANSKFCTKHAFLVVPYNPKGPFRVLIGNRDLMQYGGIQDLGGNTMSFRTEWDTKGLKSPVVSFPLTSSHP
jgi:hypothetical protein